MVLTGTGHLELLLQEDYKEGKTRDAIAVITKLGEVLMGGKKGNNQLNFRCISPWSLRI